MSDLLSRARDAEDLDCPRRDLGPICQGELIRELADEIERLRAIINAKLHRRRCHDCGYVGWYVDSRTPYCSPCDQCRSQDTRRLREVT